MLIQSLLEGITVRLDWPRQILDFVGLSERIQKTEYLRNNAS